MEESEAFRREHQAVWEMLPWHMTGTLAPAEEARVARHLAACPRCRAAVVAERDLARAVRGADPLDALAERSLAALRPRLQAGAGRPAPPPARGGWLMRALVLGQAGALALALLALAWPAPPPPAGFVTLTTPPAAGSAAPGPRLAVRMAEGVAEAAVRARLHDLGLRIVDGPDAAGRYLLAPADPSLAAWPAPLLGALQAAPEWQPAEAPPG